MKDRWIWIVTLVVVGLIAVIGLLALSSRGQATNQQQINQTQASDIATQVVATLTAQAPP